MPDNTQILIIDDEADVGTFFRRLFKRKNYRVTVALNGVEAENALREGSYDVAMVDLKLPDTDGLTLLQQIKNTQPSCEVIIMTGYSTTRTAVKAIQYGAYDYLEKPFEDIGEVENLIEKAAASGMSSRRGLPSDAEWTQLAGAMGFQVGRSPAMRRVVDVAYKIAKKNINVLIQGETGTGKEVLARFIHAASSRSRQIFIPVNCGALPENLLESELFGHEKGAFTGAGSTRRGIFEMANHGTLFLDEIGEASPAIQVKLLRVLETGEFLRVGGEKQIKTDVRLIAATNVDLEQALQSKNFREDLYYRLDVVRLELPSLRERREDIPQLAEYFVRKANPDLLVSVDAMRLLSDYPWPGNIRELANSISQAVALCDGKIILPEHFSAKILSGGNGPARALPNGPGPDNGRAGRGGNRPQGEGGGDGSLRDLTGSLEYFSTLRPALEKAAPGELEALLEMTRRLEKNILAAMGQRGLNVAPPPSLNEIEARAISDTVNFYRGNITMAARALGIGRNTLYRKIKEYGLDLNSSK
ncbi:MAG: sigma-54 dependent transcriptional regulator [Firmicutes bacterium]|nr:sigma-54 dependent transcriptional regulator [Bacillota bacterium]